MSVAEQLMTLSEFAHLATDGRMRELVGRGIVVDERHIEGEAIYIDLFSSKHARLPCFWLSADHTANESNQFAGHDHWR